MKNVRTTVKYLEVGDTFTCSFWGPDNVCEVVEVDSRKITVRHLPKPQEDDWEFIYNFDLTVDKRVCCESDPEVKWVRAGDLKKGQYFKVKNGRATYKVIYASSVEGKITASYERCKHTYGVSAAGSFIVKHHDTEVQQVDESSYLKELEARAGVDLKGYVEKTYDIFFNTITKKLEEDKRKLELTIKIQNELNDRYKRKVDEQDRDLSNAQNTIRFLERGNKENDLKRSSLKENIEILIKERVTLGKQFRELQSECRKLSQHIIECKVGEKVKESLRGPLRELQISRDSIGNEYNAVKITLAIAEEELAKCSI